MRNQKGENNSNYKHGLTGHPIFTTWLGMRQRCNDPNHVRYAKYGGIGIKLCKEWDEDVKVFYDWCIENGWTDELTIDRIDSTKDYCPENCRIVSYAIQANNLTSNHNITYNGKTQTITQWSRELGIARKTLQGRLNKGWSIEKSFTTPIKSTCKQSKLVYEWNGLSMTLSEWAKYLDIHYDILYNRIVRDKWDLDREFNLNQYKTDMADFNG